MANITFDSEFGIGGFEDNKQNFVDYINSINPTDNFSFRISSLGGSVDDAMSIYAQMKKHQGKITVELDGFNASAATIIAMGADEIIMDINGLFLVHKSMSPTIIMDYLNEEDIAELITNLEKIKDENVKIDAKIANIYAKKTGRRANTVLNLMSEDKWLTAEEAKDFGFVDKISDSVNGKTNQRQMKMVALASLPELPSKLTKSNKVEENKDGLLDKLTSFVNAFSNKDAETKRVAALEGEFSKVEGIVNQLSAENETLKNEKIALESTTAQEIAELKAKIEELNKKDAKAAATKTAVVGSDSVDNTGVDENPLATLFYNRIAKKLR